MKTGFDGTFVITWAQTEVDGLGSAPRSALGVGASWRWWGEALRLDGPQDLLRLCNPEGDAELRARAGRKARRVVGLTHVPRRALRPAIDAPLFERGFDVTDGSDLYTATVIDLTPGAAPLLMFAGGLPPVGRDLWVVRAAVEMAAPRPAADQPAGVICFTSGTRIRTAFGDRVIGEIGEGDRLQTRDNGLQPVIWKGEKRLSGARLHAMPELRPIRFRGGALGAGRPDDDLLVSPSHRMLVKGARARALFNTPEVLVTARDLVDDCWIVRDHALSEVRYIHLLLPRHEVVFANGLETESFHPEGGALDSFDEAPRARLLELIPEAAADPMAYGAHARRVLSRAEAAIWRSDCR
ncbi:MAG: hemolysin-type calcium-binding protein [Rhodobacterales bacterium]|nr:MAG: hemolysin-type calcium-binding protein [Rhodobacterales bacterium]